MLCQLAKSFVQNNSGKLSSLVKTQLASFAVSAPCGGGEGPNDQPSLVDTPFPPGNLGKYRDAVIGEYVHGEKVATGYGKWNRKGFSVLNNYLKGLRQGEMTVVTGPTGFGKTTFICEYALDLSIQGVNTLFCSFEMPIARILKVMLQQYTAQIEPDAPYLWNRRTHDYDEEKHAKYVEYWFWNFVTSGHLEMFEDFTPLSDRRDFVDKVGDWVKHREVKHCVVDNLHFLQSMQQLAVRSNMDKFHYQDYLVAKFRKLASETGCHITLVAHPRKEADGVLHINSIYGSAKISQEADNVLIIQRAQKKGSEFTKYLHIVKNRYAGERVEEDRILMHFQKETFCHTLEDSWASDPDVIHSKAISNATLFPQEEEEEKKNEEQQERTGEEKKNVEEQKGTGESVEKPKKKKVGRRKKSETSEEQVHEAVDNEQKLLAAGLNED